ncbi:TonB-dependent receptor [Rhizobium sp. S152]|uniref:TonB-dependent receptor n=1 Tax=Rhizobium sp. S152 TaxID=3055038 RepID=UPI0025A9E541|nr:TonB-dependent receptor [Rhizobium sp. S152]MDM9629630.1 TonB-dependent receptor [Rhizobium sp. S152]
MMILTEYTVGRRVRMALTGMCLLSATVPAAGQETRPAASTTLSLPAGPLEGALLALARQAGLKLVYRTEITAGKTTGGVNGPLSPAGALAAILSGTGISYHFTDAKTVTLDAGAAASGDGADAGDATVLAPIQLRATTAKPSDQPYETAGSSSYISAEQIERFRGSTAGDVFKNTPGVISANNHNGGAVNVNIRGLQGQNRVRVAIDGTQQTTTTWRGYAGVDDRTYIDPDLIGGVTVSKGPSGGAAGAGVDGGVVGIRTINAKDIVEEGKEYGGRVRIGAQDNTTSQVTVNSIVQQTEPADFFDFKNGNGSFALATVQDNFDFVVAGARRYRGNYFAGTKGATTYEFKGHEYPLSFTKPGEEVWNTSSASTSFLAKGTINIDDDQSLELGYVHYEAEYGEGMSSLLFLQDQTFRQAPFSNVKTDTFTSRYHYNPDDMVDLKVNAWMSIVDQMDMSTGLAYYLPPWVTPENTPPGDDPRYALTRTYGGDISNTSIFDTDYGQVTANYGVSYLFEDIDAKPYMSRTTATSIGVPMVPAVGTRSIASAFTTTEWEPTDWLKFDMGLRYDHYWLTDDGPASKVLVREKAGGRLNPSISATLEPIDGLQFYALYAEGVRPPTMRETMGNDGNVKPNPYLKPEVAKNWEVGINVSKDGLISDSDTARLKLSYFSNNYSNYISRVSANTVNIPTPPDMPNYSYSFDNLRKAHFAGIEISGSYDLGFLYAEGSLTYYTDYAFCRYAACSDVTEENDYASNHMPPEILKWLTVGTRLLDDKLSAGVRITHAGKRLSPIDPGARQFTGMWAPYTTVDAFATYKITDNLTFDFQAENLTDRYYIDALDGWNPSPGRTFRATLTAKF